MKIEQEMLDKGWQVVENNDRILRYAGVYKCGDHEFVGRIIVLSRPGNFPDIKPLIYDPPSQLKKHPKGGCFRHQANGWFTPHWDRPPKWAISALEYMENLFTEVMEIQSDQDPA